MDKTARSLLSISIALEAVGWGLGMTGETILRILNIIDEYTMECLVMLGKRRITSQDVINQVFELIIFKGIPEYVSSENGPEFTANQ